MESVEIVVYLLAAVVIGSLVVLAVGRLNGERTYGNIKGLFSDQHTPEFSIVDNQTVVALLFRTWQDCGLGTSAKTVSFQYVDSTTQMTVQDVFNRISARNLCGTLAEKDCNCGITNDFRGAPPCATVILFSGNIYNATCDPQTKTLAIA